MVLTLEVAGQQGEKLGAAARREFREQGGSIGREPGNHWILPSRFVSGRHALIRFHEGTFFIEDTSTHGVFVNSVDERVTRPHPLKSGDRIFIKPYRIDVSIAGAPRGDVLLPVSPPTPLNEVEVAGDVADALSGAGLDRNPATPELACALGRILRVATAGVMDMLQARRQIRDEFRMKKTRFKDRGNNPLKFSENAENALRMLLGATSSLYSGPVEAFDEAFADLRAHQLAMLAGVRAAFDALLEEFEPDRLEAQFDRQLKKGALKMPARLRYWDLYRRKVAGIQQDTDTSYRKWFGQPFVAAYEEQLVKVSTRPRLDHGETPASE